MLRAYVQNKLIWRSRILPTDVPFT
jgi:hypothetical protein